jgi:hypothetical protein
LRLVGRHRHGTWKGEEIGLGGYSYFPALTANGNTVDTAAANQVAGLLDFYSATSGSSTWDSETVAGAGSTLIVPPSIAVNQGTVTIAAVGGTVAESAAILLGRQRLVQLAPRDRGQRR